MPQLKIHYAKYTNVFFFKDQIANQQTSLNVHQLFWLQFLLLLDLHFPSGVLDCHPGGKCFLKIKIWYSNVFGKFFFDHRLGSPRRSCWDALLHGSQFWRHAFRIDTWEREGLCWKQDQTERGELTKGRPQLGWQGFWRWNEPVNLSWGWGGGR